MRRLAAQLRRIAHALHDDRGTVAVSFILTLPIFWTILAIIVQSALLANAKLMTNHAAFMAGRAAVTCLPEQRFAEIDRAARLSLTPLSPRASGAPDPEALDVYNALLDYGANVAESFPARYTYTMAATTVKYPNERGPAYYLTRTGQSITVTVSYRFQLTVPVAKAFIGGRATVGGVDGRYYTIVSTCQVQTAHGRQAVSDDLGWPSQ